VASSHHLIEALQRSGVPKRQITEAEIAWAVERGVTTALNKFSQELSRGIWRGGAFLLVVLLLYKYGADLLGLLVALMSFLLSFLHR